MIKMQFYLYFFNSLIKALLKASPFLWWCFLKCFEIRFNMIPKMLFVYENTEPISVYRHQGASYLFSYWIANIRDYSTSVAIKNYASNCNVYFFFNQKTISWYIKDVYTGGPYGTAPQQWNNLNSIYYWFCFG